MRRKEIVRALQRLAFAAEMKGDRRARAWSGAAWALRQSDEDLHLLAQEGRLTELKGVGRSTAALVADLLDDLRPALLDELEADLPAGLFELRKVKGLGPKKVKALWEALGVASLAELEQACRENRLVELKGFGAKTQQKVLAEIARLRESAGKRRRDQAWALVRPVLRAL
ncbi:MAG TPA: helix-hairpin-helix domain-containing protein, partial [Polyangiaceae bacterium LLY-WYZ-15_(1-7)]|nr:helix-hairpin-helix domain-containing protein [Polyangiaceae bacterium LLY-WYZ-15_(1-7)]